MIIGTVFSITPAFVYWLAGYARDPEATRTRPTIGDIVAFTTLQCRLFFPLGQLLNVQVEIQGALALFDRIFEYLELTRRSSTRRTPSPSPRNRRGPDPLPRRVVYLPVGAAGPRQAVADDGRRGRSGARRGATLREADRGRVAGADRRSRGRVGRRDAADEPLPGCLGPFFALRHRLRGEPGQLVALVGPSGSGKTTTTYLVPRLYDVEAGSVEIDGIDVRESPSRRSAGSIGFVTQETYLFHATIRANLLYAKPTRPRPRSRPRRRPRRSTTGSWSSPTATTRRRRARLQALRRREAADRDRPGPAEGPAHPHPRRGHSALDTVSERLIQAALEPLMEGRTTLAIAHRLSTILRADLILVYERGRIVERGTHAELLARAACTRGSTASSSRRSRPAPEPAPEPARPSGPGRHAPPRGRDVLRGRPARPHDRFGDVAATGELSPIETVAGGARGLHGDGRHLDAVRSARRFTRYGIERRASSGRVPAGPHPVDSSTRSRARLLEAIRRASSCRRPSTAR